MSTTNATPAVVSAPRLAHPIPPGLVRALGHDLRIRILDEMARGLEPASASILATALGEPLGNTSYHLRVLRVECGAVEQVYQRPVRGATETFVQRTPAMVKWHDDQDALTAIAHAVALPDRDAALQAVAQLVAGTGRTVGE